MCCECVSLYKRYMFALNAPIINYLPKYAKNNKTNIC